MTSIESEMTSEDYHKLPAVGSSGVRDFVKDPLLFQVNRIHPKIWKPHFEFGDHVHKILLEGWSLVDPLKSIIAGKLKGCSSPFATKVYKEFKKDCFKDKKIVMHGEDLLAVSSWVESAKTNETLMSIYNTCNLREVSYFVKDPITKLDLKCRLDMFSEKKNLIGDVKTISPFKGWDSAVEDRGYHIQAAFYVYVMNTYFELNNIDSQIEGFLFITYDKERPYKVRLRTVGEEHYGIAVRIIEETLPQIKECLERNTFGDIFVEGIEESKVTKRFYK